MASTIPLYQLDVFAPRLFAGNPAAVCPLPAWLPDAVMQQIAAENNLAETAFFAPDQTGEADFLLRWFTPTVEVDLCGHATLAGGHVLLDLLGFPGSRVRFGVAAVRCRQPPIAPLSSTSASIRCRPNGR